MYTFHLLGARLIHIYRYLNSTHHTSDFNTVQPCKLKDRQQAVNRLAESKAWRAEREVRAANQKFGSRKELAMTSVVAAILLS
jgi:hypothetical protein